MLKLLFNIFKRIVVGYLVLGIVFVAPGAFWVSGNLPGIENTRVDLVFAGLFVALITALGIFVAFVASVATGLFLRHLKKPFIFRLAFALLLGGLTGGAILALYTENTDLFNGIDYLYAYYSAVLTMALSIPISGQYLKEVRAHKVKNDELL